ncbi:MAG: AmmeMemoRadiSam system radical SAM enzyme [Candidatus Edwardsbacteria bacterium]
MKEALSYEKKENNKVRCLLCPHYCLISEGKTGICRGRKNLEGRLFAINYGQCTSLAIDPIEKKPLYHFHPGSEILSTGPNGCNLACPFCQNWEISQTEVTTEFISPENLVDLAKRYHSIGIAYTYSEPLIWYEYLLDVGKIAKENELLNVLVTNGMINEQPLRQLLPLVDAMNIDLKSIRESFYQKICKGDFKTVSRTIEICKKACHIELTNLIIPTLNDSEKDLEDLVDWAANLGVETPVHFSRYFPHYKMSIPATPVQTLKKAYEIAKAKLRYVYVGNVWLEDTADTYCYNCGALLVSRSGYYTNVVGITDGKCTKCEVKAEMVL